MERQGSEEGVHGSTSLRKQVLPDRKRGANLEKRERSDAAVCCTLLHDDCTKNIHTGNAAYLLCASLFVL